MGRDIKVIMLSWEFPPRIVGGIAPHVYDLSLALSRLDVEVHVITCDFPGAEEYEKIDRVKIYRADSYKFPTSDFASWTFMMNVNMIRKAIEIVKQSKRDIYIIHAHDWLVAKAAISLKHIFRLPMVATIHSTEYGRRNGLYSNYQKMIHQTEKWFSHEAWRVICCSYYMASHISSILSVPKERIVTLPNGVDINKFVEPYNMGNFRNQFAEPTEKLILYVGRLVYEKGAHILIRSAPKILQEINAKFIIVGEGYLKDKLMKEAWDLGLGQRIYFTGFLSDKTVKYLYRTADVFVAPSLYEPFGIVALEAMAAKTPVVVTGVGGLSEIVEHEKTGVVVYPNNPDSLAWGIIRMLKNKIYSEKIRDNAFRMILSKYQWPSIANKTKNFYRRILDEYVKGQWKPTL